MKYKGFLIKPVYTIGSDFGVHKKTGGVYDIKSKSRKNIEYYEIIDPMENNEVWTTDFTQLECKNTIDKFLSKAGMKSNLKSEWDKLYK